MQSHEELLLEKKRFVLNRFFVIWYLFWEYFYFEKIIYNYKRYALKKMVIICCSTLTALFSWLLLHTQAKENSWHQPPNKQSQQSIPYKNYVWSKVTSSLSYPQTENSKIVITLSPNVKTKDLSLVSGHFTLRKVHFCLWLFVT